MKDVRMAGDSGSGTSTGSGGGSFWDSLSGLASGAGKFLGENKDLLFAAAQEFNKYQREQAKADAQNALNQTYATWSGFNPNLMNMIKPVEQPNVAESVMGALTAGPSQWQKLTELYDERKRLREEAKAKEAAQESQAALTSVAAPAWTEQAPPVQTVAQPVQAVQPAPVVAPAPAPVQKKPVAKAPVKKQYDIPPYLKR